MVWIWKGKINDIWTRHGMKWTGKIKKRYKQDVVWNWQCKIKILIIWTRNGMKFIFFKDINKIWYEIYRIN